ncbi:glycosyltransferase [Glutamicibacter protophormiae]|uniref:glycosyltransferase n=1 Tax=Kocuria salsicia TaxID=664639 RepID=UPI0006D80A9B|nr:glycosyltransferase [Kocuria salsicia]WNB89414.1 glycosyltransferase [Glutamicibacter protophormiae]
MTETDPRAVAPTNPIVSVACVTQDRPRDVAALIDELRSQTDPVASLCLVDAGRTALDEAALREQIAGAFKLHYRRSVANLGGAGGFSLAILTALASGADQVWLMDDDAHPEDPDCLRVLRTAARGRGLAVVSPLIVAPQDHDLLSFPFRLDGGITHRREDLVPLGFIDSYANFFNGALMDESVFFRVGLPDLKLFLRGDEVDFLVRLRKSGLPFGTVTTTAVSHPPGWDEEHVVIPGRLQVLIPPGEFKQRHFFRNRGYVSWRYKRVVQLGADVIGYPAHYLKNRDLTGLLTWARLYGNGIRGRGFGGPR